MVNIKMPEHYWNVLNRALNIAKSFYNLDFANAFELLFSTGFKKEEKVIITSENANEVKNILFANKLVNKNETVISELSHYLTCFEGGDGDYDLTAKEALSIAKYLDFVSRIWLGQWCRFQEILWAFKNADGEPFTSVFYMPYDKELKITICRNKMLPVFIEEGICGTGASFGIYSDVLHDDVRILYGIYKALQFAVNGNPSDRDIVKHFDTPVEIRFPYKEIFVVKTYEETKKWLNEHPIPSFINDTKPSYAEDENTKDLYVYLNDMHSLLVKEGDKIFVCENNCLEIEKDGKLYTYNNFTIS